MFDLNLSGRPLYPSSLVLPALTGSINFPHHLPNSLHAQPKPSSCSWSSMNDYMLYAAYIKNTVYLCSVNSQLTGFTSLGYSSRLASMRSSRFSHISSPVDLIQGQKMHIRTYKILRIIESFRLEKTSEIIKSNH